MPFESLPRSCSRPAPSSLPIVTTAAVAGGGRTGKKGGRARATRNGSPRTSASAFRTKNKKLLDESLPCSSTALDRKVRHRASSEPSSYLWRHTCWPPARTPYECRHPRPERSWGTRPHVGQALPMTDDKINECEHEDVRPRHDAPRLMLTCVRCGAKGHWYFTLNKFIPLDEQDGPPS